MRSQSRCGFTLVELLVVITIIGILVGLMLPAVNAAREAARRAECMNNLKQLALACLQHESAIRHLPTGGWSYRWAGDPDRGFSRKQPGGWHFNILPYIEQQSLHDFGQGGANKTLGRIRAASPVGTFVCPTRRRVTAFPYVHAKPYYNIDRPSTIGRSDYAANAGDTFDKLTRPDDGPPSLAAEDKTPGKEPACTGVVYKYSMVEIARISDGAASTYLIGEKFCDPDHYSDGTCQSDDQGWDTGYDFDVNRWTALGAAAPMRDQAGIKDYNNEDKFRMFGSAHASGFHVAFCDGSVQRMDYAIDPEIHRRLGNRSDGLPVGSPGSE